MNQGRDSLSGLPYRILVIVKVRRDRVRLESILGYAMPVLEKFQDESLQIGNWEWVLRPRWRLRHSTYWRGPQMLSVDGEKCRQG